MSSSDFWSIISEHVLVNRDGSIDARPLVEALASMQPDKIRAFGRVCRSYYASSRTRALWGAAGLIHDGAPDDTFDYFRSWLIGRGREAYEAATRDPDRVAEWATPEALDDVVYCAADVAFRRVAGREIPDDVPGYPPLDESPDYSEAGLRRQYPRLYEKFRGSNGQTT